MQKEYTAWVDKYRPQTIDDCILPDNLKSFLGKTISGGLQQNLLLYGGAGTGKTTAAKAICEELGLNYIFINASDDNGIDMVRTQIKKFASSQSFGDKNGKPKVVILDEADYLRADSAQPALRSLISEFAKNCRFILTCNYKNRLIEPLQSRFAQIEFSIPKEERRTVMSKQLTAACDILTKESVKHDKKVVAEVIKQCFPDFRKVLQELQKYAIMSDNNIDVGILSAISDVSTDVLMSNLKSKQFEKVRQWVADNADNDPSIMYRKLYDALYQKLEKTSLPQAIVLLADYQYKAAFVADQHINLLACLTEIMMGCEFV